MTNTRRKIEAEPAPATLDDAQAALSRYAMLLSASDDIRAKADQSIAQIGARRDAQLEPVAAEMDSLFVALRAWWAVAGAPATEGKRKSIILSGCQIGERTTTPALALPDDRSEEDIIGDLLALPDGGGDYLVTRHALYRPALIKTLRAGEMHGDYRTLSARVGLGVSQREEFFIDTAIPSRSVAAAELAQ
jgi:phage host-nuclease inhibitor protein Gam